MNRPFDPSRRRLAVAAALAPIAAHVSAQDAWPTRPVRIVVPFAPGGGGDAVVRAIADRLAERLGQQVLIDNRPGASGYVGAQAVKSAEPDGHTLLMGFDGSLVVAPNLIKAPFDATVDFAPITKLCDATLVLAAHPGAGGRTIRELVDVSRARPGGLQFGSSGAGTTTHLAGELLARQSGMQLQHVPYKGGGQAVADAAGGQIPLIYTVMPTIAPFVKSGRLVPIAVGSRSRSKVMPDVPTMIESGVPGYEVVSWYGLLAPARTPRAIVERLNREVVAVLALPDVRERYEQGGFEPVGNAAAEFGRQIREDLDRWGRLVKETNLKIE